MPGRRSARIRGAVGETAAKMIFPTGEDGALVYWTYLARKPGEAHVRHLQLTPDWRLAFVDVHCGSADRGRNACAGG